MTATVERFGPPIGSSVYEGLRASFMPMNPPATEMVLNHFVVPMPQHEINFPHVSAQVDWKEGAEKPLSVGGRDWMESYLRRFFARATMQRITDDITQVEVFSFLHPEGEDDWPRDFLVQPVIKGGLIFENEFERQILIHKVQVSLGPVTEHPWNVLPSVMTEDILPTVEERIASGKFTKELLATATLQTHKQPTADNSSDLEFLS